jgi:transposase
MGKKSAPLQLSEREKNILSEVSRQRTSARHLQERAAIIVLSSNGESQAEISRVLGLDYETIRLWRKRWHRAYENLQTWSQGPKNKGVKDLELKNKMLEILTDAKRKGTPAKYTNEQIDLLTALACENPDKYGVLHANWTYKELARISVQQGIFTSMIPRTIGKLLKKKKLKPYKNQYWLFPTIDNWANFVEKVSLICQLIMASVSGLTPQRHLISVDEKTGIQALERFQKRASLNKGGHQRTEFEYTRHGTTGLIAGTDVGTGKIEHFVLQETRNEADFANFIHNLTEKYPKNDEIVILLDNLNTHKSETLVKLIAEKLNITEDLGIKGKEGILKNMVSRTAFLETESHRIRFVFTPKHCSWLNPIENWFGKLQRQALTNASFKSVDELIIKIGDYIEYYNACLFKPLKWKFEGFSKIAA